MDIKELDKKQLILLTLLITFVVSIATGIITVSLMKQMPASVPQTINNVIQRTIEKVTTVEVPASDTNNKGEDIVSSKDNTKTLFGDSNALVSIYLNDANITPITSVTNINETGVKDEPTPIGQGIIISDIGLVLVDSDIIKEQESYKVILDKIDFKVSVLKKFDNGFIVLKISPITADKPAETLKTDDSIKTQ